jgi:subtilisin family serine protease
VPDDQHIQTSSAKKNPETRPWIDMSEDSHSTCTAGKAVGRNFGASKQAKLVVVQLGSESLSDFEDAIGLIVEDIKSKPERMKKSVVTMSWGYRDLTDRQGSIMQGIIQGLFDIDVPLFASSGNDGRKKPNIDSHPAFLATPEFPSVSVGSADIDGIQSGFSQGGPHLTLHAVGSHGTCMGKTGDAPLTEKEGTSLAAPLVAGTAANFLSYDTVPFDTSDGNLVKNLRDYLESDQGSWARIPGTDVVW